MPNIDLMDKTFSVPNRFRNLVTDNKVTYSNMKKLKSELEDSNPIGVKKEFLKWIDSELDTARKKVEAPKKIRMDIKAFGDRSGGNNFKDTHTKDKKNTNPTKIGGLPDISTLTKPSNIFNNKIDYLKEEINDIIKIIKKIENNQNGSTD